MNILIIDCENMGLDFALRSAAWDHKVKLFPDPAGESRYGEGFKEIELVQDYKPHMDWAKDGLIILTGNYKYTHDLDRYRDYGYPIFAPTVASARLELDRMAGMEAMKGAGLELLPYDMFDSLEECEKAARKSDQTYVFKALDGAADDKALTYVSTDQKDLCGWLKRQIKAGCQIKKCMLQEKIEADFEIGANGWFGPEGFLPDKYQISFEAKPLMPGDIGPNTGEQIGVAQYVETDKLVEELLVPLAPALQALGHRGDFCVGAIIDKKGKAWPLEVTARFGYPAFFGQVAVHRGDPSKWMRDLLDGKDTLKVSYDPCAAVVLAQPPYPYKYKDLNRVEGNPIQIAPEVMDDLHFAGVMKQKDEYLTASAYVMVATSTGKALERMKERALRVIEGVRFPDMMYRNDVGDKVMKALPQMHKAGYAKHLK